MIFFPFLYITLIVNSQFCHLATVGGGESVILALHRRALLITMTCLSVRPSMVRATSKPKIVGGLSPFSFPSPPLPLSLRSPSPFPVFPPLSLSGAFPCSALHCPPLISPSLPSHPLPLEIGPLNPDRGSGERCKLTHRGLGRSPSRNRIRCILALKYHIGSSAMLMIFLKIIFCQPKLRT